MKKAALPLALLCCACSSLNDEPAPYERFQPQSEAEINYVKSILKDAQTLSFESNREYCGYITLNETGDFSHTDFIKGKKNHCTANAPNDEVITLASFHTHGAFSEEHDSEIPSSDDLKADIYEGLDGYISTPGGRLWYSSAMDKGVTLICNRNCLLSDPDYENIDDEFLETRYSLEALKALED